MIFNIDPVSEQHIREYSPLVLAFVGDAVQTLFVRTNLAKSSDCNTNALHRSTSKQVKAPAQCQVIDAIMETLTEEEIYFFKRGRNMKTAHSAKNASVLEYRKATGFECLLGYLYLTAKYERLHEILKKSEDIICQK